MRSCVLWHSEGCEEGTLLLQQLCRKPTQAHVLRGLILAPMQLLTFAQDNTFPSTCLILGPLFVSENPHCCVHSFQQPTGSDSFGLNQPFMMGVRHPSPSVAHPPRAWAFSGAARREVTHSGRFLTVEGSLLTL